jgi:hypothetical protein
VVDLLGRHKEIEVVRRFLGDAATAGGALLFTGPAGIGRTAVLEMAMSTASATGAWVFRAAGVPDEADLPFAGLSQLLAPLGGVVERLAPGLRAVLSAVSGRDEGDGLPADGDAVVAAVTPSILFYPRPVEHSFHNAPVGDSDFACAAVDVEGGTLHPLVRTLPSLIVVPLPEAGALDSALDPGVDGARGTSFPQQFRGAVQAGGGSDTRGLPHRLAAHGGPGPVAGGRPGGDHGRRTRIRRALIVLTGVRAASGLLAASVAGPRASYGLKRNSAPDLRRGRPLRNRRLMTASTCPGSSARASCATCTLCSPSWVRSVGDRAPRPTPLPLW